MILYSTFVLFQRCPTIWGFVNKCACGSTGITRTTWCPSWKVKDIRQDVGTVRQLLLQFGTELAHDGSQTVLYPWSTIEREILCDRRKLVCVSWDWYYTIGCASIYPLALPRQQRSSVANQPSKCLDNKS